MIVTTKEFLRLVALATLAGLLLVFALATVATAQLNPVDRILRGSGRVIVNADGSVTIQPQAGRGTNLICSAITPPVSDLGSARFYLDCSTQSLRISINAGPYVAWTNPAAGPGTVTSVGFTMPSQPLFTVTGSPITTAGTISAALNSQNAGTFFAAPTAANGAPTFRTMVPGDVPALDVSKLTSGVLSQVRGGTGIAAYTFGDLLYANGAQTLTKLPGNTTAAKRFLTQTGDGSFSGVPAWAAIQAIDLPVIDLSISTPGGVTNTLPIARGGTGLTALGGANRLLGSNAGNTSLEYKELIAGSNVTITPTAGQITISTNANVSSGGGTTNRLALWSSGTALTDAAAFQSSTDFTFERNIKFSADNSFDIGGTGVNRPRDVRIARDLYAGNSARIGAGGVTHNNSTVTYSAVRQEEITEFFNFGTPRVYTVADGVYRALTGDTSTVSTSGLTITPTLGEIWLDPVDYQNVTFTFETIQAAVGVGGTHSVQVQLWNATDGTEIVFNDTAWNFAPGPLSRSGTFTISGTGKKRLIVRYKIIASGTNPSLAIYRARLVAFPKFSACGASGYSACVLD